uniref:Kelch domain-containing protein 4-like n=1 Tax=Phallusia mammillata TaxID=59560 RepID=A0A6F9DF70_9ASCI|nr:kelch domain-containing protein 4-like [Phallusia mammillata]
MGKKGKKEKGRGAEKAANKLAKKDAKNDGMEDLEAMIAEFKEIDRKRTTFNEEKSSHPSPRSNLSVVAHPEKDELILFGGEYFNGRKTFVYNDTFVYSIKKNEWTKQLIPQAPPPRCAHQAVAVSKEGGQMWIFGGEFASPNNAQFYHYKDLWVLSLKDHKWEEIKASGGPSQRSGHRMAVYKKSIFVFGGFHESSKNFLYFNDCFTFSLTEYKWTKLTVGGNGPSPRSACQLTVTPNGILVVGGYSKVKLKKDLEKGSAHTDMFLLADDISGKFKWSQVKDSGNKPWPRSNFSLTQMAPNRAVMFGGVCDEDLEEDIDSYFFNSLHCIDLVSYRWFNLDLRKPKVQKKNKSAESDIGSNDDPNTATNTDEDPTTSDSQPDKPHTFLLPCARMNANIVLKKNYLFVYGGVFEEKEKQVTLNDLWSIDVKKMDEWKQIVEADDTSKDWMEEEDEEDSDESDEEPHSSTNDTNNGEGDAKSKPCVLGGESFDEFWARTSEQWLEEASSMAEEDIRADETRRTAKNNAKVLFFGT